MHGNLVMGHQVGGQGPIILIRDRIRFWSIRDRIGYDLLGFD